MTDWLYKFSHKIALLIFLLINSVNIAYIFTKK